MTKESPPIRYEVITQEDGETGEVIIPIPLPLFKKMGWKEGDEINIDVDEVGQLRLRKK